MTYDDLIAHYATEAEAGRAIGVERQTVHRWQKSGSIPLDQQCRYEVASDGKLKADIPPELRVTPEPASKAAA